MRAIDVLREFNISLSTLHAFLLSKGIDIKESPNQKLIKVSIILLQKNFLLIKT